MQMKFDPLKLSKNLALVCLLLVNTQTTNAQLSPRSLSLEEAVQLAIQHNKQIKIAQTEEAIAISNYNQTEAIWLPNVNLSHTAFSTNNPLNVFGFKLQQGNVQAADFNPAQLNNPNAYQNYSSQVAVQQPIVNVDALYMRKAAKAQVDMYAAQSQRTQEAIKMQVVQTYLYLEFAYAFEKVTQEANETMSAIYKFTKDRFDQGMMQKSDLLNVEVQVKAAELQKKQASSQIETISDQLTVLMGAKRGTIYSIQKYQLNNQLEVADSVLPNRSDIKALNAALNSYDMAIKSTKMSWLPKLNSFANYTIDDQSIGMNGAKSYMAGVQLSWDIFKGNQVTRKLASQKLEKYKVQTQLDSQIESGTAEIKKTKRAISDANYKIQQQLVSVQQSEEALRILQNRYLQGLVSTNDILVAQTQLSQQKLFLAQAQLEQKSAMNFLDFLTTK
jgi:outer membrane protein TolC